MFTYLVVILTGYGQCRTNGFSILENAHKYIDYEIACNHAQEAELYYRTPDGYTRISKYSAES